MTTAVAETLVRDRFRGRATRKLLDVEAALRGVTAVTAIKPLTLIDANHGPGAALTGTDH